MWEKRFDECGYCKRMQRNRGGNTAYLCKRHQKKVKIEKRIYYTETQLQQALANRDAQWEKLLKENVILTKGGTYLLEYDFIKKIKEKLNETNKNNPTAICDVTKKDHQR